MAKPIHMMVRALDEKRSDAFYEKAFSLAVKDRFDFDGFTLVYLKNAENDVEVELTLNHGRTDPYTQGTGYGHLAVSPGDLDVEYRRFSAAGLNPTPIKEFHRDCALMAKFFFVQDPDGYKIEVLQL